MTGPGSPVLPSCGVAFPFVAFWVERLLSDHLLLKKGVLKWMTWKPSCGHPKGLRFSVGVESGQTKPPVSGWASLGVSENLEGGVLIQRGFDRLCM